MIAKKLELDDATVRIMRRMLNTPPKPHEEMKVGRPPRQKKRAAKSRPRVASAKQRSV
jgi:hypothetical protein